MMEAKVKTVVCPDCDELVEVPEGPYGLGFESDKTSALERHSLAKWEEKNPGVDPYARWRGEA